jgi:hypothetical protein
MLNKVNPLRSAGAFFLIALSTAFLFSLGVRMTGWFTGRGAMTPQDLTLLGLAIMIAVLCLVVGAGLRRMSSSELQSALLGASAVLMATPLATDVLLGQFQLSTAVVSGLGLLLLALGILVAFGRKHPQAAQED